MKLIDKTDGYVYELTDNEFRAIYVLMSECLGGMGGSRPKDIHEDPYTWTHASVLTDNGWTRAEARGTYGSLDKKGLISIEMHPEDRERWEDTVNEHVFDMFEDIFDDINEGGYKELKGI